MESTRDPADALLTVRDVDGVEDEPPSPADVELFQRVRDTRARTRAIRRSAGVAGIAALALLAALLVPRRAAHEPIVTSEHPAEMATSTPTPPTARVEPPAPRKAERSPRATASQPDPSASEPAALPSAVTRPPVPDVRVQVAQAPSGGAVNYTVRVSQPDGAPVTDADVRLRGVMADGALVEARLDPAGEPGVYQSLLTFSPRGPRDLTLRVASAAGVIEMPVGEAGSGGSVPRP